MSTYTKNMHEQRLYPRLCEVVGEPMVWSANRYARWDWSTQTKQIELKKIHNVYSKYRCVLCGDKMLAADKTKTQIIFFEFVDGLYMYVVDPVAWNKFDRCPRTECVCIPRELLQCVDVYKVTDEAMREAERRHVVAKQKSFLEKRPRETTGVCCIVVQKRTR